MPLFFMPQIGGEFWLNYRNTRNYENLERRIFDGVGEYEIPELDIFMMKMVLEDQTRRNERLLTWSMIDGIIGKSSSLRGRTGTQTAISSCK